MARVLHVISLWLEFYLSFFMVRILHVIFFMARVLLVIYFMASVLLYIFYGLSTFGNLRRVYRAEL